MNSAAVLQVLVVEDSTDDYELVLRELRKSGYTVCGCRVEDRVALERELGRAGWDIIISDWCLPTLGALEVLAVVRAHPPSRDLPFIVVSGTVSEDVAVQAMRAGAHDFMDKAKLARLGPAVERELREARLRSEQRQTHEQLLLVDRLSSVGALAAGVAHEINNPLAALLVNLEVASAELASLPADRPIAPMLLATIQEELRDACEGAERIRSIVADLRVFSRAEPERREDLDVREVLDGTLRLARNEIRHRAQLLKEYEPVPLVTANDSRLRQVFLNLAVNAAQAIDAGGNEGGLGNQIIVRTRTDSSGRAVIEFQDTGPGIPPEVLPKLFTPFFSTKAVGVGTGLGLSISFRIVAELGGTIEAFNAAGGGALFRVTLPPRSPGGVLVAPETSGQALPMPRAEVSRRRILIVDDDRLVASALERLLAGRYEVIVDLDAQHALAQLIQGADAFDLVLCDLMMPHMSGMDFQVALSASHPELARRIVFVTGGACSPEAQDFIERTGSLVLEKPLDTLALLAHLERLGAPEGQLSA